MRLRLGNWRALCWLLAALGLGGCSPFLDNGSDEKNPLISDGLAKKAAYNYAGAVESFEKALEGNPRLARAHWELGLLYSQNVPKPAFAIYHLERLLELKPDWRQADTARRFIDGCKIELAKSVPLGPQTPQMQQQLDKLTAQVHEMANDNTRLRQQTQTLLVQMQQLNLENIQLKDKLRALQTPAPAAPVPNVRPAPLLTSNAIGAGGSQQPLPAFTQAVVNPPASPGGLARGPSFPGPAATDSARPSVPSARTYVVRSGDRLGLIAEQHGVKLKALIAANPDINPNRLKVGQVIKLPSPHP